MFPCDKLACRFIYCQDLYSGLLGPLVVCRPGTLSRGEGSDRQRADVEVEFALLFMVHDENESWYKEDNIRKYLGVNPQSFMPDEDFGESNMMHGKRQEDNQRQRDASCSVIWNELTMEQRVRWFEMELKIAFLRLLIHIYMALPGVV